MANRIVNILEALKLNNVLFGKIVKPFGAATWYEPGQIKRHDKFTAEQISFEWEVEDLPVKLEYEVDLENNNWGRQFIGEISQVGGKWRITCEQIKD